MSRANTRELVGLAGRYLDIGHPCLYPDLMMRLRPRRRCRARFLEIVLRSPGVRQQLTAGAQGTSDSMVKISGSLVMNLRIPLPALEEQDRILGVLDDSRQRIAVERDRLGKLKLVRQGLMDDLLSGAVGLQARPGSEQNEFSDPVTA